MNNKYKNALSGVRHSDELVDRIFDNTIDNKNAKNKKTNGMAPAKIVIIAVVVGVLFGTGIIGGIAKEYRDNNNTTAAPTAETTTEMPTEESTAPSTTAPAETTESTTAAAAAVTQKQKPNDDNYNNATAPIKAAIDETVTLSGGTKICIGGKIGVLENAKGVTAEINKFVDDDMAGQFVKYSYNDTVAPGDFIDVYIGGSDFDYSKVKVNLVITNNTRSKIKVKDAQICYINIEKKDSFADEAKINAMGITTDMTMSSAVEQLNKLGYSSKGRLDSTIGYDDTMSTLKKMPKGSYYKSKQAVQDETGRPDTYLVYAKTKAGNYTILSFENENGENYCSITMSTESYYME